MTKVLLAMTVHNRMEKTKMALETLDLACASAGVELVRSIVDDGSTDGTWGYLESIARSDDTFRLGDGSLFWAGGMRVAIEQALGAARTDYLLMMNDDVVLTEDSMLVLLEDIMMSKSAAIVGRLMDSKRSALTYGGYLRRSAHRPITFDPVFDRPRAEIDAMNANVVLFRSDSYRAVGGLDDSFTHSLADFDLALRANSLGHKVVQSSKVVGECDRNSVTDTWLDPSLARRVRVKRMVGVKGLPPSEWARFCWRHGGVRGLPYVVTPWLRILLGA